jgi:NAD(P)-dependent dehydrogenase (short-subunit alcohol dehydrogenase family)
MNGAICLITGSTSGIGEATALSLMERGATVVLIGRNQEKTKSTAERLKAIAPPGRVEFLVADLSIMADVRRVADEVRRRFPRVDLLVNNAGAIFLRRHETAEGLESTFALNYLAYFLLTNLLVDRLVQSAPSRVINVASSGHFLCRRVDFDDLQGRRSYRGFKAYHQSKLAVVMFTYEMARKLEGTGVTVNAVDPGMVDTSIGRNNGLAWRVAKPVYDRLFRVKYVSAGEGARGVVQLASSIEVRGVTGQYFVQGRPEASSPASYDRVAAARLWKVSEALTQLFHSGHATAEPTDRAGVHAVQR